MNSFNHWMIVHVPGYRWCYWRWHSFTSWVSQTLFTIRHGYNYADCWSLDYSMAKWMAPRLRHLANNSAGCPCTYGMTQEEIDCCASPEQWTPRHDQWVADINKAAKFFEDIVAYEDGDFREDWQEVEADLQKRQREVFTWMATWYRGLWD